MNAIQFVDAMVSLGFTAIDYGGKTGWYGVVPSDTDSRFLVYRDSNLYDIRVVDGIPLPVNCCYVHYSADDDGREYVAETLKKFLDETD